ncbi:hypothetical protein [Nocardia sp. CY41]|uniref:hypothetical protein n=1 Tax=Nocardia sp. CY41 TaxID=2608686 RepID=UPI0019165F63|nr:hypothetical protein [Nocardia sp. CY41]
MRNVAAAEGHALLRHGDSEEVRLKEVDSGQRAAILRRYVRVAPGARPHIPVGPDAPLAERIASDYTAPATARSPRGR